MKTKETSNQMGKCEKCGATQFLSYGICNYNGICNGKIIAIQTSTRTKALEWWNSLSYFNDDPNKSQMYLACHYGFDSRTVTSLTDKEIEEIFLEEMNRQEFILEDILFGGENSNYKQLPKELEGVIPKILTIEEKIEATKKANQKQFKTFNESLFLSYINKFSDEDKLKARRILESTIPQHLLIEDELKRLEE